MTLTFDRSIVEKLLANALTAKNRNLVAADGPGLLLFGDHGVYLMSNASASENIAAKDHIGMLIAHADQVNPNTMPEDEWMRNKLMTFGSDNGCDFLCDEFVRTMLEHGNKEKVGIVIQSAVIMVVSMKTHKPVEMVPA